MGTRPGRERLTSREAQALAEQDAALAATGADPLDLLEGAGQFIAEIDELLVERPFLLCFTQWDGE